MAEQKPDNTPRWVDANYTDIRDKFAIAAVPAIIDAAMRAALHNREMGPAYKFKDIARDAYGVADAMMKERLKNGQS